MKSLKIIIVSLVLLSSILGCSSSDDLIGDWAIVEPFQGKGRSGAVTFTLGETPYVGLGIDQDVIELNDCWKFLGSSWQQVASFPGRVRFGAVAFAGQNYAYVGLGYALNDNSISGQTEYFSDFWRFDPNGTTIDSIGRELAGRWTKVEDFPGTPRRNAIGFAIGNYGYVGTGYGEGTVGELSDYWQFNMTTEKWVINQYYPHNKGRAREGAVVWVIGESAYVALGYAGGSDYINDVYKFTPNNSEEPQWEDLERLKSFDKEKWNDDYPNIPRAFGVAFVVGNDSDRTARAYITTGTKGSIAYDSWEFNPYKTQGAWEEVTNFPSRAYRVNAVAFTYNGFGYVTTGGTSTNAAASNTTRVSTYIFYPGVEDDDENDD
ncbi:MAG: hypothetical protein LIO65_08445 [Odoribacter sp.]|nr:hypothetical protein [Odoribacter sp.]